MNTKIIIDRVRKLLALGTSPNCHEAASALAMAHRLMAEHRISETDIANPVTLGPFCTPLDACEHRDVWRGILATAISEKNGCLAFWIGVADLYVIGTTEDTDAVKAMYRFVLLEIDRLTESQIGKSEQWLDSYRRGIVDVILERFHGEVDTLTYQHPYTGLVAVHPRYQAAVLMYTELFGAKKMNRKAAPSVRSHRAYGSGRSAGRGLV